MELGSVTQVVEESMGHVKWFLYALRYRFTWWTIGHVLLIGELCESNWGNGYLNRWLITTLGHHWMTVRRQ